MSPPVGTPEVLSPADELADDDGLASGCGAGLTVAEPVGVVVALADFASIGDFDGAFEAVDDSVGLQVL